MVQMLSVMPAAIVGVMRMVWCRLTKLYQAKCRQLCGP